MAQESVAVLRRYHSLRGLGDGALTSAVLTSLRRIQELRLRLYVDGPTPKQSRGTAACFESRGRVHLLLLLQQRYVDGSPDRARF